MSSASTNGLTRARRERDFTFSHLPSRNSLVLAEPGRSQMSVRPEIAPPAREGAPSSPRPEEHLPLHVFSTARRANAHLVAAAGDREVRVGHVRRLTPQRGRPRRLVPSRTEARRA